MEEICTVKIKLTNVEVDKIIWCIKSIENVLSAFEINPDKDFRMKLNELLKNMEKISDDVKEEYEKRTINKTEKPNPKKEYIDKITGTEGS